MEEDGSLGGVDEGKKGRKGFPEARVHDGGIKVEDRKDGKPPPVKFRVGYGQIGLIKDEGTEEKDVEVDDPGTLWEGSLPPHNLFH